MTSSLKQEIGYEFISRRSKYTRIISKKLEVIRKKLAEYDYKQLKEFSADEIESISMLGLVEDVIIDFDNPIFSTRLGRMTCYNHFRIHHSQKEYVDSKVSY